MARRGCKSTLSPSRAPFVGRAKSPYSCKGGYQYTLGSCGGDELVQRMVFDAARQTYNQDGATDDGTRSCPTDVSSSSYYYGDGPYDYVHGLADQFQDVLHVAEQSL
ncbi:UNVERIFIED_CONTAM: hypothetical protein Sradi_3982700 [Sesamum radiatum]|uniref:Uncharacterized protein n=1 Tax=Sesamum radiatum TaxID=300843 RepID=A0AAW2PK05_SESRA